MYLIRCKRKKKKLLTWTAAILIGEMTRTQKGCFSCKVLNMLVPESGGSISDSWCWGKWLILRHGSGALARREDISCSRPLLAQAQLVKWGSREVREKRNRTWQHFVPGAHRWQSAPCWPVLCCDKLVFRYLTASYETKVREGKGWRCRLAGISWLNQHVLAPPDFPPFLFLSVISSSHTPTQSPHTAPLAGGTGATAPLPCTYVFGLACSAQRRVLAKLVPS